MCASPAEHGVVASEVGIIGSCCDDSIVASAHALGVVQAIGALFEGVGAAASGWDGVGKGFMTVG
jgi:hypothetical protein